MTRVKFDNLNFTQGLNISLLRYLELKLFETLFQIRKGFVLIVIFSI